MRDPERLNSFYDRMKELHKVVPNWRFGQLIYNFIRDIGDPFYIEDDKMISLLEEWLTNNHYI